MQCRGCGQELTGDDRLADGCPCNSARGVNHGLVPVYVCTCNKCDPEQTGSVRPKPQPKPPIPCAQEQLEGVRERLKQEQDHDHWHIGTDHILSQLTYVLDNKRSMVAACIARTREFQQDVLTFLRAFSLMLETVGGASTHSEKAARLRGLTELVETAARRVRERQFREQDKWSYSMADDVFRCDYPVRYYIDKMREAEARALAAEEEAKKIRETWAPTPSV